MTSARSAMFYMSTEVLITSIFVKIPLPAFLKTNASKA